MVVKWSTDFDSAKKHICDDVDKFIRTTEKLIHIAKEVGSAQQGELEKLTKRLEEILKIASRGLMKVVFFGKTSNGKSTVMNALLGAEVLPSGPGSVSSCFCSIQGRRDGSCEGVIKVGDRVYSGVETAERLASHLSEEHLDTHQWCEISWPTQRCELLMADVVLVDSPGLSAMESTDELIEKYCKDADVFVYVCNGVSTLERPELEFMSSVSRHLCKPSNSLIAINNWDTVVKSCKSDAKRVNSVRRQHCEKASRFLTQQLNIVGEEAVREHVFFVSGKEMIDINKQLMDSPGTPRKDYQKLLSLEDNWEEREEEFKRFDRGLKERLTKSAVVTKFSRLCVECQEVMQTTVREQCDRLDKDIEKKRRDQKAEIRKSEMEIRELKYGRDDVASRCEEMINRREFADRVREKVEEAIENAKARMKAEIDDNGMVVHNQEAVGRYLAWLCRRIQPCLNPITANLHMKMTRVYSEFTGELKDLFAHHTRYSPEVHESEYSIGCLPSIPTCETLSDGCTPKYTFLEYTGLDDPNTRAGVGTTVAAGTIASMRGSSIISTGILAVTSFYAGYKAIRWFGSDDWKKGINGKIYNHLISRLDESAADLKRRCIHQFENGLREANECLAQEFGSAIYKKDLELSRKLAELESLDRIAGEMKIARLKSLPQVQKTFEEFRQRHLEPLKD